MTKRIDKLYLKPQIKVIENGLIEWSVIYIVFFSRYVYFDIGDDLTFINILVTIIFDYIFFGMFYMGVRTSIGSYLALRKVVMAEDER